MDRDCATLHPLLDARLDGRELAAADRTALDAHLAGCPACRALAADLASEDRALAALWPPVAAPAGFAARTVASLPPRAVAPPARRRAVLAAAVLVALLAGGLLGRGETRARIDLALQWVGLRDGPPPAQIVTAPVRVATLDEVQRLVPWRIRQPDPVPPGYRLSGVTTSTLYAFAVGPEISLYYRRDGAATPQLVITQFRVAPGATIDAPIAPGAGRRVPVGGGSGLLIEGLWMEDNGRRVWEPGTLVRLIVEDGDLVLQLAADPSAGWDGAALVRVAEGMR